MEILNPICLNIDLNILEEEISLYGNFRTKVKIICVNCLEEFEKEIEILIENIYMDKNKFSKYVNLAEECSSSEPVREELINGEIDIDDLVRQYLTMEILSYPKCSDNCEGLKEKEKYSDNGVDPRWAKLLELS